MSSGAALDDGERPEPVKTPPPLEPVHSLGEALAGVTLGGTAGGGFGSARDPVARTDSGSGWGNFTATDASCGGAFTALTGTSAGSGGARDDGISLFLSQDPSKTLGESIFKLSSSNLADAKDPQEPPLHKSESQSSFRLHPGAGAADLRETLGPVRANSFGESVPRGRGRTCSDSPACSVTGTTASSRSVSPYANSSQGGTYLSNEHPSGRDRSFGGGHRYGTPPAGITGTGYTDVLGRGVQSPQVDDDRSGSGLYSLHRGAGSHPSLATLDSQTHRSPFSSTKEHRHLSTSGFSSVAASPFETHTPTTEHLPSPAPHAASTPPLQGRQQLQQASQVLYMAVPSPDGRGQVLQPVQMMQMPGKPYHFVSTLPPGTPAHQPSMSSGVTVDSHGSSTGSLMVLPPLPNIHDPQPPPATFAPSPSVVGLHPRSRTSSYGTDGGSAANLHQFAVDVGAAAPSMRDNDARSIAPSSGASSPFPPDSAAVASLYAAPQRPQLEALLGQIRRLSRDQVGCRLVQQALDEEGPMAATMILNEGLPFWGEAMVDPFGNYLFQKILEKITPEERIMLVKSVSPRLVNAGLNLHGTRSVQKVVELCAADEHARPLDMQGESAADILTQALTPAAARLCIDSHGNHVIQRILLKLGPKHTKFVFDAVAANVGDVARHRHGCCVIQRCLDSPPTESRSNLIRHIVDKSLELMQDAYGNYVVQYVLDVCADEDVHAVCESVIGKVNVLAVQKFSSNVMEKCLERCSDRVREQYLQEMSDPDRIRELMMDPFGNYVVQRALSVATHGQAIRLVEAMRPHLTATQTIGPHGQRNGGVRNTAGGRRIIAKICRRFPHFTLGNDDAQGAEQGTSSKGPRHVQSHYQHHQQPVQLNHSQMMAPPYASLSGPPHYGQDQRMTPPGFLNMPPVQSQQQPTTPSFYSMTESGPYFPQQAYNSGFSGYSGM